VTRLSRRQALAGGGVTALAAAAAAAPEAAAQACRPEPTTITVDAGRVLGPLPKFWRCTGFTPAELLLLPEMRQTLSFLGAVPNRGLEFVRVHYLLDLVIANYTSNRQTKGFIIREAQRKNPSAKEKSGIWYRLNRWREAQVAKGPVTYEDLVEQFIVLNGVERFERIPHPRYINFLAEYHAAEKGASREDALAAWRKLKKMDVPKTYASWRAVSRRARGR